MPLTLAAFGAWDWAVLVGYLVLTTWLGTALAGKQQTMQDFFRGGNKLPWYAVAGSMIATEISAVTFVGVPSIVFAEGGNFTYLQLGLFGGLIARFFVAFVLIPAYYQKRVYSPYDYMGNQLGRQAKQITTALFSLGGVLAQSARVYLTAIVLELVLAEPLGWLEANTGVSMLVWAVVLVGLIAIVWTAIGGIATVIWTDVMLFCVFVIGGVAALWVIISQLPGGFGQFFEVADEAGKFQLFDDVEFKFSPTKEFTIWTAAFAVVFGNIGAYGTDQLMAQRIFCCRGPGPAKIAVITSWFGQLITATMLLVGAGLYVFYKAFPERLTGGSAAAVAREGDKIFPVFILEQIPVGITGLIIAGIFAAAISSLTSILAALSQTTLSAVYLPWRAKALGLEGLAEEELAEHDPAEGKRIVLTSRILVVFWGVVLCVAAFAVDAFKDATNVPILSLALGLGSYITGSLLAAFLLAYLPLGVNGRGLVWSAPLAVLGVFASRFHEPWAYWVCGIVCSVLLISWLITAVRFPSTPRRPVLLAKTLWLGLGIAIVMLIARYGYFHEHDPDTGKPTVIYSPKIDEQTGEPVVDPDQIVPLFHPITSQPIIDPLTNEPYLNLKSGQVTDPASAEPKKLSIAWPWYAPLGGAIALVFGYLLGEPKREDAGTP